MAGLGISGPIPNRSDQRVRRNKPNVPIDKVEAIGTVPVPDLDMPDAHPLVKDLYESLRNSAQTKYYEPSDWQMARLTMHLVNDMLSADHGRISAMKISSVNSMLASLLLTEGDRRRVRLEVERNQEGGQVLDVADLFRQRLQQSR